MQTLMPNVVAPNQEEEQLFVAILRGWDEGRRVATHANDVAGDQRSVRDSGRQ